MRKILIVEDESDVADLIALALESICDEEPIIALTMEEAMKHIAGAEKFDLITLDLRMPGWESAKTLAHIREMQKANEEGLIVVISGSMDPNAAADSIAAGAHGFIAKPAVAFKDTFLDNLKALALSLIRQPTKYQQNLKVAEALVERLAGKAYTGKICEANINTTSNQS